MMENESVSEREETAPVVTPGAALAGERTGPLGRFARLAWAAIFAVSLASIVGPRGSAQFRDPHILTEPSAWLLHLAMLVVFVILVGTVAQAVGAPARRAQTTASAVLVVLVALAAVAGQLLRGAAWGFPLADVVWIFDVVLLAEQVAALGLSILLGTPGCEVGVWAELIARIRGEPRSTTAGLACVVGLQLIDRWEASRR